MSIETLRAALGWCALMGFGLLTLWWLAFAIARDRIIALHGRWFRLAPGHFDLVHYTGMALLKIAVIVLFLLPCLALRIVA